MRTCNLFTLLSCGAIWSSALIADDFPEAHIARQIESAKTPIEISIASLRSGQLMTVEYVDMPVWIYRRTIKDIESLQKDGNSSLADPKSKNLQSSIEAAYDSSSSYVWGRLLSSIEAAYDSSSSYVWGRLLLVDQIEKTQYRSLKEETFVVGGWSPYSGCVLTFYPPENRDNTNTVFYDPCTGASFDAAGRVFKGMLSGNSEGNYASYNLYIPPYQFKNDTSLFVGLTESKRFPEIDVSNKRRYVGMKPTEKLITACKYNDLEIVEMALKEGANVNYSAIGKVSPMDAAIIGSSMSVIELLIANGAKPTPNSANVAKFLERPEVVKLLERIKQ